MDRLLNEHELDQYRQVIAGAAGTGTGSIPSDFGLLLGHVAAQAAMLQRGQRRERDLADVIEALIDVVEHGGDDATRERVVARAREMLRG
jgi:hypothetical protein